MCACVFGESFFPIFKCNLHTKGGIVSPVFEVKIEINIYIVNNRSTKGRIMCKCFQNTYASKTLAHDPAHKFFCTMK